MNIKQLKRKMKKQRPKTWARVHRRWDIKMIGDVSDFTFHLLDYVNPKAAKAIGKNEYLIKGPEIEEELWKLLEKVRRITQRES